VKKTDRTDLLRGTLDLLILQALTLEPHHGLGVARRVEQLTQGAFQVNPGSLFPALHRLEQKGWVKSAWGASAANRKAKYYQLTATGRRQLKAEAENWGRISVAIARALRVVGEGG
jgi:transcriptional regulator